MRSLPSRIQAVKRENDACVLLDQTLLPNQEVYLACHTHLEVADAIRRLVVRGAPAIGVAAAYGVCLAAQQALSLEKNADAFLAAALSALKQARPTAVNLAWAVEEMRIILNEAPLSTASVDRLWCRAAQIHELDIAANREMAKLGAAQLSAGAVLTYCNTGELATGGVGTAFGVLHQGFIDGRLSHVYACETRPVLQGLRLTAWELEKNEIPFSVICDNMAGLVMRDKKPQAIILGSDRIAANGDAANKIGTYSLAVLAKHHSIPFYVVAPWSTFDLSAESGADIPIEQRAAEEITGILNSAGNAPSFPVYNPAFDVTPAALITAIICERGVIDAPTSEKIAKLVG